jgi:hypothetical protein
MKASLAHRLLHHQDALISMSAPTLLREQPLRAPLAPATARLEQSLSLRELVGVALLRKELRYAQ